MLTALHSVTSAEVKREEGSAAEWLGGGRKQNKRRKRMKKQRDPCLPNEALFWVTVTCTSEHECAGESSAGNCEVYICESTTATGDYFC